MNKYMRKNQTRDQKITAFRNNTTNFKLRLWMTHWLNKAKSDYILRDNQNELSLLLKKIFLHNPPGTRSNIQLQQIANWLLTTEPKRQRYSQNVMSVMSKDNLFALCQHLLYHVYDPDEVILLQNEESSGLYIILSGEAYVYDAPYSKIDQELQKQLYIYRISHDNRTYPRLPPQDKNHPSYLLSLLVQKFAFISTKHIGDCFGEVSLLSESGLTTASIITKKTTEIILVPKNTYNTIMKPLNHSLFIYDSNLKYIHDVQIFHEFQQNQLLAMVYWMEQRNYSRGTHIISRSSQPNTLMFIYSGEVKLTCIDDYQQVNDLSILGYGGILCENTVFNEKTPLYYDCVCLSEVIVITFTDQNFKRFLKYVQNSRFLQIIKQLYQERETFRQSRLKSILQVRMTSNINMTNSLDLLDILKNDYYELQDKLYPDKSFNIREEIPKQLPKLKTQKSATNLHASPRSPNFVNNLSKLIFLDPINKGNYWKESGVKPNPSINYPSKNMNNIISPKSQSHENHDKVYNELLDKLNNDCTMKKTSTLWNPSKTRTLRSKM